MYKINPKISRVFVFHHNDMDGYVSAAIVKHFMELQEKPPKVKLLEVGYSKEVNLPIEEFKGGDVLCVIVDYSFHLNVFDDLVNLVGFENIIWIDHHKSAIENYKAYPHSESIIGLRSFKQISAAELTYLFFGGFPYETKDKLLDKFPTFYNPFNQVDDYETSEPSTIIPPALFMVGSWDTFRFRNNYINYANEFSIGFDTLRPPLHAKNSFWDIFYMSPKDFNEKYGLFEDIETGLEGTYKNNMLNIINTGIAVVKYLNKNNQTNLIRYAFKATLDKFPELDVVALNATNRSSLVFKTVSDNFHVGIVYTFNGKFMNYSIYRLGKDPDKIIDVSNIAKCFGGGGHPGAAGFNTENRLVVHKIDDIDNYFNTYEAM